MELDKYETFLKWFQDNGGKSRDIQFPTKFAPTDYIGISAKTHIQRNTVIMAVPKNLIIGIQRASKSQIGFLLQVCPIFQGQDNDDKDFNILTLYLILQKMKGKLSFFHPYFECIDIAQTLIYWTDQQIRQIKDPYLNISFINQIRVEFEPTYLIFKEIVDKHRHVFKQPLTRELFYECYGIVMTRCFGWGLPQTMLVPFADFLNHHSNGVHHYIFSETLQQIDNKEYIKKYKQLNLQIFGIDNIKTLPISYEKDTRQIYLQNSKKLLQSHGYHLQGDIRKLKQTEFKKYLDIVRHSKAKQNYNNDLYPSSDEQDNDTNSDSDQQIEDSKWHIEALRYIREKKFFQKMFDFIDKIKEQPYEEPKPEVNRQFEDGVTFKWWYQQNDPYFIVATSAQTDEGSQIFNSYGRRNNRFLLLWYGFTFANNKYDSVPFRMWNQKIEQMTGQLLFTRFITDDDWKDQIPIGNERYPFTYLSPEFRLKLSQINYYLLAYLRFQVIRNLQNTNYKNRLSELYKILDIQVEIKVIELYLCILKELVKRYGLDEDINFIGNKDKNYRQYFYSILIDSNAAIVQAHLRGTTNLLQILTKLQKNQQKDPQLLLQLYRYKWNNEEQSESILTNNRIFLRQYFRMLHNYLTE